MNNIGKAPPIAMMTPNRKPIRLVQNRPSDIANARGARLELYKRMLDRRIAEAESGKFTLKIPRLCGLRLRLPGKPFHATPEMFFQEDGSTQFAFPEEAFPLDVGETVLVPAGMPHGEIHTGSFLSVIYMVTPDGFEFHVFYLDGWIRPSPYDQFPTSAALHIVRYTDELAAAREERPNEPLQRGLYLALLSRLREALDRSVPSEPVEHPLMHRCQELIDTHFTRLDFSVGWLAREVGCSADHLSRVFRKQSRQRLIQVIHQKRTDYAKHLLVESDMNIAETAWTCGFSHPSYFDRIFRSYVGLTPKQFRENLVQK